MAIESNIEGVSSSFDEELFLKCRTKTIEAVKLIATRIEVGMSEDDAHIVVDQVLNELGCEKKWHPSKFRIGRNTLKSFKEKSDLSIRLQEDDIFFIDIGPVFYGHEGDYGETFVVGNNEEFQKIKSASEEVFKVTAKEAEEKKLTGPALYDFAEAYTEKLGYKFNDMMKGHRLGDFPHAIFTRSSLADSEIVPNANLWVLEILITDKEQNFGAFFEDLIKFNH
ncbi:putative aminopeptidase [Halobacteriovorax marinus SJ]|uniref:Aminopeptidase n=1 Tax=Halobacteriovorax marinus (strain ATCC BAA-682 / DSM 15412 / SJ) TaxID=862908 RepID=E1X1P0_HALMS|nr:M24 family metallopeptidase [Halobacteriovorax marinus]CBW24959.1 putative aminopeptidase [Halobacteriovorax marinus SJ]